MFLAKRELLASKIAAIGQSILRSCQRSPKPDGVKAQEAVHWIQKALHIIEQMKTDEIVTVKELKV
jgi:methylphosphotriester-DNA--protein-cysteine methyltransferase